MLAIWNFSNGYETLGVLHILAVLVAFGPLFTYPSLQRAGAGATIAKLHMRLALPALVLVWVFGMGLVGMSADGTWEMSQLWITLSLIGWVILMVVSWFMIRPALSDTSDAARGRLASGIGITHLLMIVILVLMVFKPGAPAGF
ncbi:MAG: hypothetical protein ABW328_17685 [Ilumatobacteraceae bacterium]